MEYLMTYGWAILIIAVVLGVLFQLGVFSSTNFSPRAPPGSCRVFRTAGTINLEGICSGELPQYVAQFGGISSIVKISPATDLIPSNVMSISAWTNIPSLTTWARLIEKSPYPTFDYQWIETATPNQIEFVTNTICGDAYISSLPYNSWQYVTITYDGANMRAYLNGVQQGSPVPCTSIIPNNGGQLAIGGDVGSINYFLGQIANVQMYNASLDPTTILALYKEGIGGAPISAQNLIGWWPLNGDTNDYSGNNNNGAPTSVVYTSSWLGSYTLPH